MRLPMKTERQKMLAGEPYRSRDPELLAMYHRARDLLATFARIPSFNTEEKREVLLKLFGSLGRGTWIEAPFYCDYGVNINVGSDCFINANCVFLDCNTITIGNNVLIGPAVQLYTPTHPLAASERLQFDDPDEPKRSRYVTQALPITIGDDTWVGGSTILMPGVSVGARSTIGAGSVVLDSVPEDSLAAGNPCRVLRRLPQGSV
jgi:maltose O-acetyltransferase